MSLLHVKLVCVRQSHRHLAEGFAAHTVLHHVEKNKTEGDPLTHTVRWNIQATSVQRVCVFPILLKVERCLPQQRNFVKLRVFPCHITSNVHQH